MPRPRRQARVHLTSPRVAQRPRDGRKLGDWEADFVSSWTMLACCRHIADDPASGAAQWCYRRIFDFRHAQVHATAGVGVPGGV